MNEEKAKHTPGPWRAKLDGDKRHKCFPVMAERGSNRSPDDLDSAVLVASCSNHHVDWDTVSANANLIAAAPELLEALEALHARYLLCIGNEGPEAMKAREAIAKAKGEPL